MATDELVPVHGALIDLLVVRTCSRERERLRSSSPAPGGPNRPRLHAAVHGTTEEEHQGSKKLPELGEETLSERESVGGQGLGLPNGAGKEAPSSGSSAGSKRKHNNLVSNQMELNEPGTPSSSSGDSTWSIDSLDARCRPSLSRNKNDHSEHSVTSAGVTMIRQPRGVLRLRKLAQNVSTENRTGGHNVPQANGVPRSTQLPGRNKRGESIAFKGNRVGGDDLVSCLRSENGICDHDTSTKFSSETKFSDEKQTHLSGEPPKAVHVEKNSCGRVKDDGGVNLEENAARMLCSLSDNRCGGSPRKKMKSPDGSSKITDVEMSGLMGKWWPRKIPLGI